MIVKDFASESGHWYTADGTPAYTIVGKNGNERNTTLRDARTLGLMPSVTTILKIAASPGLERWKQDQILMAALTLPKLDGENEFDYIARIRQDAQEQGRQAAARGTEIHGAIEEWFRNRRYDLTFADYLTGVVDALSERYGEQAWIAEKSFAHQLGYAGKVDLASPVVVVDYKTKEFSADKLPTAYDENIMQLSAYRRGLGFDGAKCANLFISRSIPGLVHVVEHSEEELQRGLRMFDCLLEFWKVKNKYDVSLQVAKGTSEAVSESVLS